MRLFSVRSTSRLSGISINYMRKKEEFIKFWKIKALPSATLFCWRVMLDKIATKN